MKSYFVTLGFNETYFLRLLNQTSAQKEDKLIIVVPSPIAGGTRDALDNLRVEALKLHYPEPTIYEITLSDFFNFLPDHLPEPIITDLSIGMRMTNSPF
ncbi:hypothetical protein SJAV_26270 [Sulfurisphaera javensis]|uniref:Csa3 N-terminal domain-containing protein n=1 Tax=Sulfurisphaera javensis TaxID=2049879 RepID=A0AAT9GV34_9CREN